MIVPRCTKKVLCSSFLEADMEKQPDAIIGLGMSGSAILADVDIDNVARMIGLLIASGAELPCAHANEGC